MKTYKEGWTDAVSLIIRDVQKQRNKFALPETQADQNRFIELQAKIEWLDNYRDTQASISRWEMENETMESVSA